MRLRLRISRNELPIVRTLWPITEPQTKWTIAQLLEIINRAFPLESQHWGLEDYVTTVGGFECLHYHEIGSVCKDEDEVFIRPLQTAEVRARTMTGRDQISIDGKHLLDGVPFGRAGLRGPTRREIRIPPRKRRKVAYDEDSLAALEAFITNERELVLASGGEAKYDENDEDDEDSSPDDDAMAITWPGYESTADGTETSGDPGDSDSADRSSEISTDSSNDDSDSDTSSEASWDGLEPSAPSTAAIHRNDGPSDTSQPITPSEPFHELQSRNETLPPRSIPHQGTTATKTRNLRRRDQKKLKHLKEIGVLSPSATLQDMRSYEESGKNEPREPSDNNEQGAQQVQSRGPSAAMSIAESLAAKRQSLLDKIAAGGVEVTSNDETQALDFDERPEEMSSKGVDMEDPAPTSLPPIEKAPHTPNGIMKSTDMIPTSVARRARLDLAGSKRMLFGSLGVRVPKTEQEKDALRRKLADDPTRPVLPNSHATADATAEGEKIEDFEDWQSKIELSAVECCDEGVRLSTPPFPFYQRWDSQYQSRKKKKKQSHGTSTTSQKRKRDDNEYINGGFTETYDKYNPDGGGDALDYDDVEVDEYWEEDALLNGQEGEDSEESEDSAARQLLTEAAKDNATGAFPALPEDMTSLPALAERDARKGDYVTYNELVCSAATKWQPLYITRTVQLLEKQDNGWSVEVAPRDLRSREYDDDGQRVYSKFEMQGLSDDEDEDDERMQVIEWKDIAEPKLLQRRVGTP